MVFLQTAEYNLQFNLWLYNSINFQKKQVEVSLWLDFTVTGIKDADDCVFGPGLDHGVDGSTPIVFYDLIYGGGIDCCINGSTPIPINTIILGIRFFQTALNVIEFEAHSSSPMNIWCSLDIDAINDRSTQNWFNVAWVDVDNLSQPRT